MLVASVSVPLYTPPMLTANWLPERTTWALIIEAALPVPAEPLVGSTCMGPSWDFRMLVVPSK
jgi:hypothetical protein